MYRLIQGAVKKPRTEILGQLHVPKRVRVKRNKFGESRTSDEGLSYPNVEWLLASSPTLEQENARLGTTERYIIHNVQAHSGCGKEAKDRNLGSIA